MNKTTQKKQLKIIFATNISGLGGGETSLLNLLMSLKEKYYGPIFVCPPGPLHKRASLMGLSTIRMELPPIRMLFSVIPLFSALTILRIVKLIRKNKIEIVHVESYLCLFYFGIAAWISNVPCVATYHGYWHLESRRNQILLKLCRRIFPVSKTTALDLKNIVPDDKVRIIPLGLNNKFLSGLPPKNESRVTFGWPLDQPIVIQVARFQPIKGQMILLEAMHELVRLQKKPFPLVVFVGDVLDTKTEGAAEYEQTVKQRAMKDDIQDHVCFLGWQEDIPRLMRAADIVIIPSDFETFSMTVIEAMAVGTFVIATSSGGPSEIIRNQITGVLVPPKNPIALANAIHEALTKPSRARAIALKAREFAIQKYSPQIRYKLLIKEYVKLLSSKTGDNMT